MQIKIHFFYNLKSKIDLSRVLNKNFLKTKIEKLIYKFAKSVIKINSVVLPTQSTWRSNDYVSAVWLVIGCSIHSME